MNAIRIRTTALAGLTVAVAATLLPVTASAGLQMREFERTQQPLKACTAAIESEMASSRVTSSWHSESAAGGHVIYVNVDGDDDSGPLRVRCETDERGDQVLDLRADAGRWVEEARG